MGNIDVDLDKGLEADGWPRGPWRTRIIFDKNNKQQMLKLTANPKTDQVITAEIEIKVR